MRRSSLMCTMVAVFGLAACIQASSAEEKKTPTIKEIMVKAHKTGTGLLPKIGKELKAEDPAWDTIQEQAKELLELSSALEKNKPAKGDRANWEKLCQAYVKGARTLEDAARAKDKAAALAAQRKLAGSCLKCHEAHREDE